MDAWIGVDLDGTLAEYHGWQPDGGVGPPIAPMVERVKGWLAEGRRVKIFTARVGRQEGEDLARQVELIRAWTLEHLGQEVESTCRKDFGMVALWDDRCVQVVFNVGIPITQVSNTQ